MNNYLQYKKFKNIDLEDSFFDSLKNDYDGFEDWFNRKADESAYVLEEDSGIQGFLYLKYEYGTINDIDPALNATKSLKIGTLKINPHGTRLGERFIKKALDYAAVGAVDFVYVTVYEHHTALVRLFNRYGFFEHGTKGDQGERVLVKNFKLTTNDILEDYPLINTTDKAKYLLAIYPMYHSVMFPDSILNNESIDILSDVTVTNSIHKTYVTTMAVNRANRGDILVMYRTASPGKKAEYSSVVTSICIVEEVKHQSEFADFDEFFRYASTYSIFDRDDLYHWYQKGKCFAMKMTYNAALSKRLIRKKLADEVGLDRNERWSFISLTDDQFNRIIQEGEVSESIIIN